MSLWLPDKYTSAVLQKGNKPLNVTPPVQKPSTFSPSSNRRSRVVLSVFSSSSIELPSAVWSCNCSCVSSSPPSGADRDRLRGGLTSPAGQEPRGSCGLTGATGKLFSLQESHLYNLREFRKSCTHFSGQ